MKTNEIDPFFKEYTAQDAVLKYSKATAGYGISYLLEHDYKDVYIDALGRLPVSVQKEGLRVLEFGCGAGMNLLHLVGMLEGRGIPVGTAVGSDFSPVLIETATRESKNYTSPEQQKKIKFCVAKNETLLDDLSAGLGKSKAELKGAFDFIIGVNTIRYAHRAGKENECARDVFELLSPGGVCVAIDMNDRCLIFRTALRDRMKKSKGEYYKPSLERYTLPFAQAGFEILRSEHFCWIPHSSGKAMCGFLHAITPILDGIAKSRAMRSLVVARKPS
jgi:SAM-dependent methyltransferase